jgi:hypothetical protein
MNRFAIRLGAWACGCLQIATRVSSTVVFEAYIANSYVQLYIALRVPADVAAQSGHADLYYA